MTRLKPIFFLVISFLILSTNSLAADFKVTRVYDGDTIKAQGHDIEIKVRLLAIDTPETSKKIGQSGQPYSQEAKKYLSDLVLNKVVRIKGHGIDMSGRILGVISLDDKNINLEIMKAGLAQVYRGKLPDGFNLIPYRKAEKKAREKELGIWSLGNKYVSPMEWRRLHGAITINSTPTRSKIKTTLWTLGLLLFSFIGVYAYRFSVEDHWKKQNVEKKHSVETFKLPFTIGIQINTIAIPLVIGAFAWTYEKIGGVNEVGIAAFLATLICLGFSLWESWSCLNLLATRVENDYLVINPCMKKNIDILVKLATQYSSLTFGWSFFAFYIIILIFSK